MHRLVSVCVVVLGCSQQVGLGSGQSLRVDRQTLEFGKVRVSSTRELELLVTNPSSKGLEVEPLIEADERGAFSLRTGSFSLAGSASLMLTVRYTAGSAPALDEATLVLSGGNAPDTTVLLQGEAVRLGSTGPSCGDGVVSANETCDPPGSCATTCADDGNACTREVLSGSAVTCDVVCEHRATTACMNADGCCPSGCSMANDSDCSNCGNGRIDFGEVCEGASCPTSCTKPTACTSATLMGSASECSAQCSYAPITTCVAGDGCCPTGCFNAQDSDCSVCGNGTCEATETCASCLADCGVQTQPFVATGTCTSGLVTSNSPQLSCSPELVVVGVYQPTDTPGTQDPILVTIKRTRPIVLVVSSRAATRWDIHAAVPGVQIEKLVVSGFEPQQVALYGMHDWMRTTYINRFPGSETPSWLGCGYEWPGAMTPGSCNSAALVAAAEQLTGTKASLFVGCYEGNSFTIE